MDVIFGTLSCECFHIFRKSSHLESLVNMRVYLVKSHNIFGGGILSEIKHQAYRVTASRIRQVLSQAFIFATLK